MTDAKSRYEIVEGLVDSKNLIIDKIATAENDVLSSDAKIKQTERDNQRKIEDMHELHETFINATNVRIGKLNSKVKALDEAIDAIKAISGGVEKQKASSNS